MSSSATPPGPPDSTGTHAVGDTGGSRRRLPVWLWAVLAVVAIVVLLLILRACTGGDGKSASSTTSPATSSPSVVVTDTDNNTAQTTNGTTTVPPTTSPPAVTTGPTTASPTTPAPVATGGAGTLDAAGKGVLPLSAANGSTGSLAAFAGKSATATSVVVQSVPVDNGFWIGTSATNRVWVQLLQPGLVSPHPVRVGDHVTFTGTMIANPAGFAQTAGLTAQTGAAQLTAQGAHVQAAKTSIVFK